MRGLVRYPRCGRRINNDRVTELSLHHPISKNGGYLLSHETQYHRHDWA